MIATGCGRLEQDEPTSGSEHPSRSETAARSSGIVDRARVHTTVSKLASGNSSA